MSFYSRIVGNTPTFDFIRLRFFAFSLTAFLILGSFVSIGIKGFNFGIDFAGGLLVEVHTTDGQADIGKMRSTLDDLKLGEISLQEFGQTHTDVMIRVPRQDGDEHAQMNALTHIKEVLGQGYDYRRVEIVVSK